MEESLQSIIELSNLIRCGHGWQTHNTIKLTVLAFDFQAHNSTLGFSILILLLSFNPLDIVSPPDGKSPCGRYKRQ